MDAKLDLNTASNDLATPSFTPPYKVIIITHINNIIPIITKDLAYPNHRPVRL